MWSSYQCGGEHYVCYSLYSIGYFSLDQVVSVVNRYMAKPRKAHWQAVKWILRYIYGVILALVLSMGGMGIDHMDSDYGGDLDDRKSTLGYMLCLRGLAISWRSALQEVIVLSTTELEYVALTKGFKEAQWLGGFVGEFK